LSIGEGGSSEVDHKLFVAKTKHLENLHGHWTGFEAMQTFCGQRERGSIFFYNFVQISFMDGPVTAAVTSFIYQSCF